VTLGEVSRAMGEIDLLFSHSLPAEWYFLEGRKEEKKKVSGN
jgi:hypothetical protein